MPCEALRIAVSKEDERNSAGSLKRLRESCRAAAAWAEATRTWPREEGEGEGGKGKGVLITWGPGVAAGLSGFEPGKQQTPLRDYDVCVRSAKRGGPPVLQDWRYALLARAESRYALVARCVDYSASQRLAWMARQG